MSGKRGNSPTILSAFREARTHGNTGVGLLRRFAVGALVVFVVVGAILYAMLYADAIRATEERARTYAEIASAAVTASDVIQPGDLKTGVKPSDMVATARLGNALNAKSDGWESATLFSSSGVVVVSSNLHSIGTTFPPNSAIRLASGGRVVQRVMKVSSVPGDKIGAGEKLVTYAPWHLGGKIVGALQIVQARPAQQAAAQSQALGKAAIVGLGLLVLYLALLPVVAHAARVQEEQRRRAGKLLDRERETVQRLKELDAAKDELLAFSAHEFRTPLTSLLGFAQTLAARRKDLPDELVDDYLETIVRQARRLQRVANDFLDVAAIEAGRLDVVPARVGALEVAADVAGEFAGENVSMEAGANLIITADAGRLEQVLTNLVRNALAHGPKGGPVVLRVGIEDAGMAVFDVVDSGTGLLDHEDAERLFDKFERGEGRMSGSGLGLYIARHLVEAQHGTLAVDTAAKTTTFRVRIPLAGAQVVTMAPATLDVTDEAAATTHGLTADRGLADRG